MAQPKSGVRKAPGLMSFVVWRQFFMVLGAPGIATALLPMFGPDTNFIVVLVISAVPALVHGQLWKWTYDWHKKGPDTLRKLRIGQIVLGLVHLGLSGWALSQVATGAIPWEGSGFYFGLTIAGALGGLWETIRPGMELQNPPESNQPAPPSNSAAPAADRGADPPTDSSPDDPEAGPGASAAFGDGTHEEPTEATPESSADDTTARPTFGGGTQKGSFRGGPSSLDDADTVSSEVDDDDETPKTS